MNIGSKTNLRIFKNAEILCIQVADCVVDLANRAVKEKGRCSIVLSGGETPKQLYTLLAQKEYSEKMPWQNMFVFWGDERCVGLTDYRNNAYQAKQLLLNMVPIPPSNVYPIHVNLKPEVAAQQYENKIKDFFGSNSIQFDLILLGLGENGHTASLFPNTKVLQDFYPGIREVYIEQEKMYRITMTAPLINTAQHIIVLVEGKSKSEIVKAVLEDNALVNYPFQLIHPKNGTMELFIDEAAASLIS